MRHSAMFTLSIYPLEFPKTQFFIELVIEPRV